MVDVWVLTKLHQSHQFLKDDLMVAIMVDQSHHCFSVKETDVTDTC